MPLYVHQILLALRMLWKGGEGELHGITDHQRTERSIPVPI